MEKEYEAREFIQDKLSRVIIDPSLLFDPKRYPEQDLEKRMFYIPASFLGLSGRELWYLLEFYGPYLSREEMEYGYRTFGDRLKGVRWEPFNGREYLQKVPKQFLDSYEQLISLDLPVVVSKVLQDEFVFLVTQSCLVTRLKKNLRLFEKFNIFPLLNLERIVPPEWAATISGMKKWINWVAFIVGPIALGAGAGFAIATTLTGIRLAIIDP